MALQQSIDLALAENIGEAGLPQTALDAARAGVGERREAPRRGRRGRAAAAPWPAGRDPGPRRDPRCRGAAPGRRHGRGLPRHRRIEPRRPDAGAARGLRRAGPRALRRGAARAFPRQPRSSDLRRPPRGAAACDLALRRDLEVRRHRRDPDAGDRRALRARPGGAFAPAPAISSSACRSRAARAPGTACATSSSPRASPSSTTTPASAGAIRS